MSEIYSKMIFPNTIEEYFKDYAFIDEEQIYTNGSELIPTFRVKQWEEHKDKEIERLSKKLEYYKRKNEKVFKIIDNAMTEQMITGNATINLIELYAILKGK